MRDRSREITVSWKDAQRLKILEEVRGGSRTQVSAARSLGITDRWIRRLLQKLKRRGVAGLVHGNRGRPSKRRIPDGTRERIVRLYRDRYERFNLTHFREMLLERERVKAPCREILRRILDEAGAWEARRRAPKHRLRRPRREHEGELLQLDASMHAWLGEDQPTVALVGAIDDATSNVADAQFFPAETTEAYLSLLGGILRKRGVPRSVYTDRDSVFVVNNAKEADLLRAQGRVPRTQFGRALKELGIDWIAAYSPQAKGRIERLWGTFQDRLLNELRLHRIRTLPEANEYLQKNFLRRYNQKFPVPPAHPQAVYRPAPLHRTLQSILCSKESRILARDHTFSWEREHWQVLPCAKAPALTGRRIEVRHPLRGSIEAWFGAIRLAIRPAPLRRPAPELRAAEPSYPFRGRLRR